MKAVRQHGAMEMCAKHRCCFLLPGVSGMAASCQRSACLCFPSAEIKGIHHHTWYQFSPVEMEAILGSAPVTTVRDQQALCA